MTFSNNWGGKVSGGAFHLHQHEDAALVSPGQLGPDAATQIIAYVLQVNGIKDGPERIAH